MSPVFKFTDKAKKMQTYRLGKLECSTCDYFSMDITIPIDKKSFDKYDEHANACKDLKSLESLNSDNPQILEQIEKNKEKIIRGYN